MAEVGIALAVAAITTAASSGLQYALTKKVKPTPVDRGRLDDIRLSMPGYGASLIRGYGTYRTAPIWFWDTDPIDHPVTTQGHSGGKGGGTPASAQTTDHYYTKSLAGAIGDKLLYVGVSRIWFNSDLVYNASFATNFSDTSSTRYEAEHGVLAGGASVATGSQYSNGSKVTGIGSGGNVTIHCDVDSTATYELAVAYAAATQKTFKVSVNGGANVDLVCRSSGGSGLVAVEVMNVSLTAGANTIAFSNSGASAPDLDCVSIAPALSFSGSGNNDPRSFTGLTTPGKLAPSLQDAFWPASDEIPVFSDLVGGTAGGGFYTATLSQWGNPIIRIYPGSEDQPQDSAIIADKGIDNTPAYRGTPYIVIDTLQITAERPLPNVTVEVQQGMRELVPVLTDLYDEVGVPATKLDLSQLGGLVIGDAEGFNAGTYTTITWAGLNNATAGTGGAITKTSGTNNTWNSYADASQSIGSGTDASIRFTAGNAGTYMLGFSTITTPGGSLPHPYDQVLFGVLINKNSKPSQTAKNAIQMSLGGSTNSNDVGQWATGDQFQVEIRNGRFSAYQNGLLLGGFTVPVATFPMRLVFAGYAVGGGPSAASFATGANIGSEPIVPNGGGLVSPSQTEAAELVVDLMTRFQFDLPEVDGVVKAVLRNQATADITISEDELRAHRGGEQRPAAAVTITNRNPIETPKTVEINFLNPQYDYHNDTADDSQLISGPQRGINSISLNLVETRQNMKNLAVLLRHKAKMEAREFKFATGPKYIKAHKGTRIDIQLNDGKIYKTIVDSMRSSLPAGVIEFTAKRHAAEVFSPFASGFNIGLEHPIVPVPGNTKGMIIDGPLLRPEDGGDGTQPVVYIASCGRGSGTWPGNFIYREFPIDSDSYALLTTSANASSIGVTVAALASVSDPLLWDRSNSLTVNFYSLAQLESVTEDELLANPELNLLAVISPSSNEVEYIQFKTASAGIALPPYLSNYTISTLLRGRVGTDNNVGIHSSTDDVVVIDSTIRPRRMELGDIGRSIKYKFQTVGQSTDDAEVVSQGLTGNSLKPLSISNPRGTGDSGNDLLIEFEGRTRIGGGLRGNQAGALNEEVEEYRVQILNGGSTTLTNGRKRVMTVIPGMQQAAVLIGASGFSGITHNSITGQTDARSVQSVHGPGNFIEATLKSRVSSFFTTLVGLMPPTTKWQNLFLNKITSIPLPDPLPAGFDLPYIVALEVSTLGQQRLTVWEYGAKIFSASDDSGEPDYDPNFGWFSLGGNDTMFRIRFNFVGSTVRIQKAHTAAVPLTTIAVGQRPVEYPLTVYGYADGTNWQVQNVIMTTYPFPKTIYSAAQQSEDGFTPGDPIQMDIWQYSKLVGDGVKVRVTL